MLFELLHVCWLLQLLLNSSFSWLDEEIDGDWLAEWVWDSEASFSKLIEKSDGMLLDGEKFELESRFDEEQGYLI